MRSLAAAHAAGAKVDWRRFFEGTSPSRVPLPTYPFQRERFWLDSGVAFADVGAAGLADPGHPLLGASVEPSGGGVLLSGRVSLATHPWLADHAVGGNVILPGTAFLELALAAAELVGATTVEELTLEAPLALREGEATQVMVEVGAPGEDGRREVSIHARPDDGEAEWARHAGGALSEAAQPEPEPLDVWPPEGAEPLETGYLYVLLGEQGLRYGPAFRGLTAAWRDGEEIYAEVALPDEQARPAERFGLHPALLDAALHGIALGALEGEGGMRLPFSWSGVGLAARGAKQARVRIVPVGEGAVSLLLADAAGAPLASVESLALRPLEAAAAAGAGVRRELLEIGWSELELGEAAEAPAAETLAIEPAGEGAKAGREAAARALSALQAWLADESKAGVRLTVLSAGAVAARPGESPDPAAAAVWGLVRTAQSEHPGRFALIDSDGSVESQAVLDAALALGAEEPQLALREGRALAPRAAPLGDSGEWLVPPPGEWRLDAAERGTLESLALLPREPQALGPRQVRIEMRAAGLNFRDVLAALGMYPGEVSIGGEGAGVVTEVGEEVEGLRPGDRAMGLVLDAFAPSAVAERDFLIEVPQGWSFEQAAAMPVVCGTAMYGLRDLADLKPGERVLIHAGAGGVGAAAIQIAQASGAEVFATASPGKWDVLREAGLDDDHIASSRDLEFRQKFLDATGGEGMDVVLNALAGEFVDASLDLLPRGGRFLEMGKTDVREAAEVEAERPGLSYIPFDVMEAGLERTGEILAEVAALVEAGEMRHARISTFDVREAPRAFRELREGRNVGKLVLTLPRPLDPERTALVTGATGGLGALLARHLVEAHGARRLLLVSRSGPEAEGAAELRERLEALGAEVEIAACDVADRAALAALLDSVPAERPLGAVVHCAGVLDDATIERLSSEQLERVFRAKADSAWNLHELTGGADLDAFVLFSSAVGRARRPRAGQLRRRQRLLRRAGRAPPGGRPAGDLDRLGVVGERRRDGGRARRGRPGADAPRRDRDDLRRARPGDARRGAGGGPTGADRRAAAPRRPRRPRLRRRPAADPLGARARPAASRRVGLPRGDAGRAARGRAPRARAGAGPRRGRRGARPRLGHRRRRRQRLPGPRLRLARRGRAAQPAERGHRPLAGGDDGLRLPDAAAAGAAAARRGGRERPRPPRRGQGARLRGAAGDRRHGLPLPGRRLLAPAAVGAGRRGPRRGLGIPGRPRLGPGAPA